MATDFNFSSGDLSDFDSAPGDFDLSAFDAADGNTFIPPGSYVARVERGELLTTKSGKPAYRIRFSVIDGPNAAFILWRYFVLDAANAGRSKQSLKPLGLSTSVDLKAPFPPAGRLVKVKLLVTLQKEDPTRNDVERVEFLSNEPSADGVNPFGYDPSQKTGA
ncbi:hypothetical protein [Limnoglobus roseus]|uniref:DUF669 domain-containing protein n=1 Tax=Limnoglobus roseus TaxID=2598579 RepID=A0A5C1AN31_9BACT|nr:hypothetical protein [Limnoglobus roseus]QEL19132.1 hypothetical protein PX52LOC_06190 [Limnoglobus roseus]